MLKRLHHNLVFCFQVMASLMVSNCIHIMDSKYILLGQSAFFGLANYVNLKNQQITYFASIFWNAGITEITQLWM